MYSARFVCMDCVSVSVPHADPQILTMKWKRRKSRSARPAIWKHLSEITRRKSNHRRLNRTEHKRRAWDIFFSFLFFFFIYFFRFFLPFGFIMLGGIGWFQSWLCVIIQQYWELSIKIQAFSFCFTTTFLIEWNPSSIDRQRERKTTLFQFFFPRECDSPKRQQNGWRHSKNKYLCTQIDKSGTQNRV